MTKASSSKKSLPSPSQNSVLKVSVLFCVFQEVDVVAAPLTQTFQREQVADFTIGYYIDYIRFVYKKPAPTEDKWWTYLAPLRWEVHLCLLGVFLCVSLIAQLIDEFHPWTRAKRNGTRRLTIFWNILGHLLKQGR